MSDRFSDSEASREALSALADGEAQASEVARACAAWKDQADTRATWHAYQMIGDVMRSDDLAHATPGDAFLKNFRERLAQEPVVLVPGVAAAQRPATPVSAATTVPAALSHQRPAAPVLRRRAWGGPMAVAAGFVLVVGALLTSQVVPTEGVPTSSGLPMAQAPSGLPAPDLALSLSPSQMGNGNFVSVADQVRAQGVSAGATFIRPDADGVAVIIRDPRVDHVLAAQHVGSGGEASFAGQGELAKQVVFDGH